MKPCTFEETASSPDDVKRPDRSVQWAVFFGTVRSQYVYGTILYLASMIMTGIARHVPKNELAGWR